MHAEDLLVDVLVKSPVRIHSKRIYVIFTKPNDHTVVFMQVRKIDGDPRTRRKLNVEPILLFDGNRLYTTSNHRFINPPERFLVDIVTGYCMLFIGIHHPEYITNTKYTSTPKYSHTITHRHFYSFTEVKR